MEETAASLLHECPLLLPQNRAKTVYEGFITAQVLASTVVPLGDPPSRGAAPPLGACDRRGLGAPTNGD